MYGVWKTSELPSFWLSVCLLFHLSLSTAQWCSKRESGFFFFVAQGDHHERLAVTLNLCLTNGAVVSKIWACPVIDWWCEGEWSPWAATLLSTCGFVYRLSYNTFDRITKSSPASFVKKVDHFCSFITSLHSSIEAVSHLQITEMQSYH